MSELVRTALLQSTKDEILQWFASWTTIWGAVIGGIGLIAAVAFFILAVLGINEVVTNRVTQKVDEKINEIKDEIKDRKRELDIAIFEADTAKKQLEVERGTLNTEVNSLREQRNRLAEDVKGLRIERDNIASILKETSFVVALHKLRYDLYRIRHIELKVILFWDQNDDPNLLKFDWFKIRDIANKSVGLKLTILSQMELQEFLEKKRPLSSYLQFISQVPLIPETPQRGSPLHRVISKNELLETKGDYLIGNNIDKLNNFKAIVVSSPFYESDDPFAREYTGSRLNIHNFWTSIKRVQFQLFVNWIAVATEDILATSQFTILSSWGSVGTGDWYESKPLLVEGLFQDVRSRYEQAILRQSDDEKTEAGKTETN